MGTPCSIVAALSLFVHLLITYLIKGTVLTRWIYRQLVPHASAIEEPICRVRLVWLAISTLVLAMCYAVASAVPFFEDLTTLLGALQTPLLGFCLPVLFTVAACAPYAPSAPHRHLPHLPLTAICPHHHLHIFSRHPDSPCTRLHLTGIAPTGHHWSRLISTCSHRAPLPLLFPMPALSADAHPERLSRSRPVCADHHTQLPISPFLWVSLIAVFAFGLLFCVIGTAASSVLIAQDWTRTTPGLHPT